MSAIIILTEPDLRTAGRAAGRGLGTVFHN